MAIPIQPQAPIIMNPRNPPGMTTLLALIPVNRITNRSMNTDAPMNRPNRKRLKTERKRAVRHVLPAGVKFFLDRQ